MWRARHVWQRCKPRLPEHRPSSRPRAHGSLRCETPRAGHTICCCLMTKTSAPGPRAADSESENQSVGE
eukprot:1597290-Rhodomonas_salina.1